MGIDVEMFVKTREPVTPEQVRSWSYHMGSCFGSDSFWTGHEDKRPAMKVSPGSG